MYEIIESYLKNNKTGMMATVILQAGSAPRDTGAKMFVGEDGKSFGTVGGGRLEFGVCQEAMAIMGKGSTKIVHIRMDAKEVASDGMLCGGNVDVLLEPVFEKYRDLYGRLEYLEKKGKTGVLVTRFNESSFAKTLIEEDLAIHGDALSEDETKTFSGYIRETAPRVIDGVLVEPLKVSSVLYIFGAGHVSQYIARVARMVDFSVKVIDDRAEFANRERFPDAAETIVADTQDAFERLRFTGKEFVVIVTRGHKYDADVLKETLKRETRYIGMIGSKRKSKMILEYMKESGFDDETIAKVYTPIGISIHAETPQEIAISIVAELIKVRGE